MSIASDLGPAQRARSLEAMAGTQLDVLVVGGGVVGASRRRGTGR